MSDETARSTWRREYDLVDDSTPEPVDPPPTSEGAPAVDPFAPHRADAATGHTMSDLDKKSAELRQYLDDATRAVKAERDAARADADRLAAALRDAAEWLESAMLFAGEDIRVRWGYEDAVKSARAALARHETRSTERNA